MPISQGHKTNFATLKEAFRNGDVALVETKRISDGESVVLICAMGRDGEEIIMSPFAEMCAGNPFEMYEAPC